MIKKKSSYECNGTRWILSHLQDIQQNGVFPVENKLRFSLHICPLCFSPKTYQSEYLNHAGQFYNVNGWIFASR